MSLLLNAYQCDQCGHQSIHIQGYCSNCSSKQNGNLVEVEGKGTVFSHTTIYISEDKFQSEVPYQMAVIVCESSLRVLGRIENSSVNPVKIGSKVELTEIRGGAPFFKNMDQS